MLQDIGTDFLDQYQATYQTYGDVWVENDSYGTFQLKTGGCVTAVSQSTLEGAMPVSDGLLDQAMSIYGATGNTITKSKINATEGSLVKFYNKAKVGDVVSFQYDFITDDYTPYADFSFFNIGSTTQMIAGVGTNVANFGSKTGW